MSLINDALKRAKESQRKNTPPSGVSPMRPMRPIEVKREKRDLSWILSVVIILLILTAVFFIALTLAKHTVKNIVAEPEISTTQQVEAVAAPAPNPPAPPAVIGPAAISTDVPVQTRVQGIFNDPAHPWAIVSGKTVYVGDFVDGMLVTAISRNSITLTGKGQTNTLIVGQ
jgi:hypothetical protein